MIYNNHNPYYISSFLPFLYSVFRAQKQYKNQGKDECLCLFVFKTYCILLAPELHCDDRVLWLWLRFLILVLFRNSDLTLEDIVL